MLLSCAVAHAAPVDPAGIHPRRAASTAEASWAVVGVESFNIVSDFDWWSEADVYAYVRVDPVGWTYESPRRKDTNAGTLDYFMHVPSASEVTVEIYDHDALTFDNLIGVVNIPASNISSAGGAQITVTRALGDRGSTVTVTFAAGLEALALQNRLNYRGVSVDFAPSGSSVEYELQHVPNDGIEKHVAYARTGSVFPASAQGVWWMDQRGVHLRDYPDGPPGDPTYEQQCESAADEIVVTFGEAGWDPLMAPGGCATNVNVYGGSPTRGHWTWIDVTGNGTSTDWEASSINLPVGSFCFEDVERTRVNIDLRWANLGNLANPLLDLRMEKTPWGWDRVTRVGPGGILGTCHYPVWQIVDGDGNRTEHYDAYLRFVNTPGANGQSSSTFAQPNNRGNGSQLVARLVAR